MILIIVSIGFIGLILSVIVSTALILCRLEHCNLSRIEDSLDVLESLLLLIASMDDNFSSLSCRMDSVQILCSFLQSQANPQADRSGQ